MKVGYGRDERLHDLLLSRKLREIAALGAQQPVYISCCALLQSSTEALGYLQRHCTCQAVSSSSKLAMVAHPIVLWYSSFLQVSSDIMMHVVLRSWAYQDKVDALSILECCVQAGDVGMCQARVQHDLRFHLH